MPVVAFSPISLDNFPGVDSADLRNDQKHLYDICQVIASGNCPEDIDNRKPGPVVHCRWLTTASRILRLYISSDLHMAQLIPLPLTVSCSCKIQIGFTFLVPAHLGSPGQRAIKRMCVCVCVCVCALVARASHRRPQRQQQLQPDVSPTTRRRRRDDDDKISTVISAIIVRGISHRFRFFASPSRISSLNVCQGKVVSGKRPVGERPVSTSAVCSCRRVDLSLSVRVCMCVN